MIPTDMGSTDFDRLLASTRELLGDPCEWTRHDRFQDSLALAVVDAIQSTAAEYCTCVRAVDRYRAYRSAQGHNEITDGTRDLLRTFEEVGGALNWSGKIGSYRRTYSDAPALRATTIQDAAERLHNLGIDSAADLRATVTDPARYLAARDAWMSAAGATDEISWLYLLMLVGVTWVRPQSLSAHFVADAMGDPAHDQPPTEAISQTLTEVAEAMGISLVELEHAIWRWELNLAKPAEIPADRPLVLSAA